MAEDLHIKMSDEMRIVTLKMPKSLLEAVDRYAINHRMYRSEVIRMAILRFLEEEVK